MSSICVRAGVLAVAFIAAGSALAQGSADIPRMADGKPDLSGIWWTGGDLGSAGFGQSTGGGRRSGGRRRRRPWSTRTRWGWYTGT